MINKLLIAIGLLTITSTSKADVTCTGKITDVVKWSDSEHVSILLDTTNRYIKFTDKTSASMLLAAYLSQKNVTIYMSDDDFTSCKDAWPHYSEHAGYIKISG